MLYVALSISGGFALLGYIIYLAQRNLLNQRYLFHAENQKHDRQVMKRFEEIEKSIEDALYGDMETEYTSEVANESHCQSTDESGEEEFVELDLSRTRTIH